MTQLNNDLDYQVFKVKYEALSGLKLPFEYIQSQNVYAFYNNKEMIGGFILGQNHPYRTIDTFVAAENREAVLKYFINDNLCELCCFWIKKEFRKKIFFGAKFWLQMANAVKNQPKDYVIFGTGSKSLASIYGYPANCLLLHKDKLSCGDTYVFLGRRIDFVSGVWSILLKRGISRHIRKELNFNKKLKKVLVHEMSN